MKSASEALKALLEKFEESDNKDSGEIQYENVSIENFELISTENELNLDYVPDAESYKSNSLSNELSKEIKDLNFLKKNDPLRFFSENVSDQIHDIGDKVTDYASSDVELSSQESELVNKITGAQANRLRMFLMLHTQKLVKGISNYQKVMEILEAEMFDIDRIKSMSQYEKMMLYKLVRSSKLEDMNILEEVISNKHLKPAAIPSGDDDDQLSSNLANKSPKDREKLRNQVERLMDLIDKKPKDLDDNSENSDNDLS